MPYKDKEERRAYQKIYQKEWTINNREKRKSIQALADTKRKDNISRIESVKSFRKRHHHRNKIKVLKMYGRKCAFCSIDLYEVLTVDHINNDGAAHRKTDTFKKLNNGGMWGYLSHTAYRPDLYQILCYNCNCVKSKYGIYPGGNTYRPFEYWEEMSKLKRAENKN